MPGLMSSRDFQNYLDLSMMERSDHRTHDLLARFCTEVVENIQKRGRDYEAIRFDYPNRLNERYEAWISTYSWRRS